MENCEGSSVAASTHRQSHTSVRANLPQCLVETILLKLPLDSLIRFQAVCRDWNQLLRSKDFLKRHELVWPSEEPWILSAYSYSPTRPGEIYDSSRKSWHYIDIHGIDRDWWYDWLLSDGGLICSESNVLNPLTCSIRHLKCPWPKDHLRLSAFKVNRRTNFYKVYFLAFVQELNPEKGSDHGFLCVYNSEEDSWCRTQDSPVPIEVEVPGVIINDFIYFMPEPKFDLRCMELELKIVYYNLSREEWGSCVISSHRTNCHWSRILHQWKNHTYVISFDTRQEFQEFTVSIDEVRIGSAECHTLETILKKHFRYLLANNFPEILLADAFCSWTLDDVSACENWVIVSLSLYTNLEEPSSHFRPLHRMLLYDLRTRKWSSVNEMAATSGYDRHMKVAFKPRPDIVA